MVPQSAQVHSPVSGLGLLLGGQTPEEARDLEQKRLRMRQTGKTECRHLKSTGKSAMSPTGWPPRGHGGKFCSPESQQELRVGCGGFVHHTRASKWRQMQYREPKTPDRPHLSPSHGAQHVLRKCIESQVISARASGETDG